MKMKTASRFHWRVASSKFSVPMAFTSKSVNGISFALSWEGWAAQWITRSKRSFLNRSRIPARSRISKSRWEKFRVWLRSRFKFQLVSPAGPKNSRRILLSIPNTVCPSRSRCKTASEPINPLEPVTKTFIRGQKIRSKAQIDTFFEVNGDQTGNLWRRGLEAIPVEENGGWP